MDERTVQFRVGVMVLATIIILGILLLLFGDLPSLVKGTYEVRFEFAQAPGVTPDTPVRVNGVLIGRVKSVELDARVGVMVVTKIEEKFELRKTQMGRIGGSLLGDAVIEVVNNPNSRDADKVLPGDTLPGVVAKDPFQAIINLEQDVSAALKSITKTSDDLGAMTRSVNGIINANEGQIQRIIANTDQTVIQLRNTIAGVDQLLSDPVLKENLKRTINGLPVLLDDLSMTLGGIKNTMQLADRNLVNIESLTKPLGERAPRLVESLDRSITQLDGVLTQVSQFTNALNSSQGSLSRLMNDPKLYDDVAATVANLKQLTQKIEPILNDVRVFSDKLARHPETLGVRGLIQGNSGSKFPWSGDRQGTSPTMPR
jgi:phospholipid/cholesterol/gamma-HCH transport system substrate-binding protein